MKKTHINPISAKKQKAIPEEKKAKVLCAQRAGCVRVEDEKGVHWVGGYCEAYLVPDLEPCGKRMYGRIGLHPHRIEFGSQGGKYTEDNIAMLCPDCHARAHNVNVVHSQPQWGRKEG